MPQRLLAYTDKLSVRPGEAHVFDAETGERLGSD